MLTWGDCPVVERIPGKVSGAWVIKNTRLPLWAIFENLQSMRLSEVTTEVFEGVTEEQIHQVLHHLSEMLREDLIVRVPAVPGTQQTKSMGELEAEYPGKHFAILEGDLIGVCDTSEESRELFRSVAQTRRYVPAEQPPDDQDRAVV